MSGVGLEVSVCGSLAPSFVVWWAFWFGRLGKTLLFVSGNTQFK